MKLILEQNDIHSKSIYKGEKLNWLNEWLDDMINCNRDINVFITYRTEVMTAVEWESFSIYRFNSLLKRGFRVVSKNLAPCCIFMEYSEIKEKEIKVEIEKIIGKKRSKK